MGVAAGCATVSAAKQRPCSPKANPTRRPGCRKKRNVSRKTSRYLVNVESKIKDQLNAQSAIEGAGRGARRARRFVQYS